MESGPSEAMVIDFEAARIRMVEQQLERRGIADLRVLRAFRTVPRHEFVPVRYRDQSYRDTPLPIGEGQTISQPYMVAAMTEALGIDPGHRVLEIGTGSGYQAAILAALGASVYSMDRIESLAETAGRTLDRLGYEVRIRIGDGTLGWPEEAPFDRILVAAGAPKLPEPLPEQLEEGGRLIIPLEDGYSQVLQIVTRIPGGFEQERGERCTFVPLIGLHGWHE
jgi:protein-L-isoaspartate(D-aspartate) O-methyltransferase